LPDGQHKPGVLKFNSDIRKLRLHLVVSGAFLTLCAVLILIIGEQQVYRHVRDFTLEHSWFEAFLRYVSEWGNLVFYVIFGLMGIAGLALNRRRFLYYSLAYFAVQLIASVVMVRLLKITIGRARPSAALSVSGSSESSNDSFPSGHTSDMASSASVLSYFLKSIVMRILTYVLLILMGISRIGLGKHYPLDTIGGAFLGLFTGFVVSHIFAVRILPRVKKRQRDCAEESARQTN